MEREILTIAISRVVVPTTRWENGHVSKGVLGDFMMSSNFDLAQRTRPCGD
jgi:hypothetical protein